MRLVPALRRATVVAATAAAVTTALAAPASAADVTNRTIFATDDETGRLDRLSLSRSGTVLARTPVNQGAAARALDYSRGRMVFAKPAGSYGEDSTLWLREADGRSRQLTRGTEAVFTPGGTAILFARTDLVDDAGFGEVPSDSLFFYHLTDGRVQPLSTLGRAARVSSRMRYAPDGSRVYFIAGDEGNRLAAYSPSQRKIVREYFPGERNSFEYDPIAELLPSGTRALVSYSVTSGTGDLISLNLSTGNESSRARRDGLSDARGRLSSTVYLVSGVGQLDNYLGSLDVSTMTIRALTGSSGYRDGVTAYQLP